MEHKIYCMDCGIEMIVTNIGTKRCKLCNQFRKKEVSRQYRERLKQEEMQKDKVCKNCGKIFHSGSPATRFCTPQCRNDDLDKKVIQRQSLKSRRGRKPKQPGVLSIAEIQKLAREEGISYGQYIARHKL